MSLWLIEMKISCLSPAIGAELQGVDLLKPVSQSNFLEIEKAFHEHLVLIFRDQILSPRQHVDFAAQFADLEPHPFVESINDHPEIIEIAKEASEYKNWGGPWHADLTFKVAPSIGAAL